MEERLQKIIAGRGYCSRRKAEELIRSGAVSVDGETITTVGSKFSQDALIVIEGHELRPLNSAHVYLLLNKPRGVLTAASDKRGRKVVTDLLPSSYGRLFPVGRLDLDTHGALIMTDDGEFANLVMHPSSALDKTYHALIDGRLSRADKTALEHGVMLEDGLTSPAQVSELKSAGDRSLVSLTIHEGRKREVRRMLAFCGHSVIDLERVSIGPIRLGSLPEGSFREIPISDIEKIRQHCLYNRAHNSYRP